MKAHYIPRFYLAGFVDPKCPKGHEPFLHVFEFAIGEWHRAAPKKVAVRLDYYALTLDTGEKHEDLEEALSKLESVTATLLRGKIAKREVLEDVERVHLAEFIATMLVRVPRTRDATAARMKREAGTLAAELHGAVLGDPALLERMKAEMAAEGRPLDPAFSVEDLNPDDYEIEASDGAVMVRTFMGLDVMIPHIAAMGWRVMRAPIDANFVTSDFPVYIRVPGGAAAGDIRDMLRDDVELTVPLTRDLALFASRSLSGLEYSDTTDTTVEQLNIRSTAHAETVYASGTAPSGIEKILISHDCDMP